MPSVSEPWPPTFSPIEMTRVEDASPPLTTHDVQDNAASEAIRPPPPAYRRWSRLGSLASLFKPRILGRGEDVEGGIQTGRVGRASGWLQRRQQRRNTPRVQPTMLRALFEDAYYNNFLWLLFFLGVSVLMCFALAGVAYRELQKTAEDNKPDSFVCGHNPVGPRCTVRIADPDIIGDGGAGAWLKKHCSWQGQEWLCTSTKGDGVTQFPQL